MDVLVVGSVALDTVETPYERRESLLGGSAAYFSTVASLIVPAGLVAVVGDDFPPKYLEFLRRRGINLDGLTSVPGKTFRWSGRYLDNMVDRETLDTQLNVFAEFRPQLPAHYRDAKFVFLANIDPSLQLSVLEQIDRPEFVALDTMNFWLTGEYLPRLKEVLARCGAAFLNEDEARMLSGQHNLVKAAAAIRLMGVPRVIIKRGDAGAMLFDDAGPFWAPAYPVDQVVDPTGAGDCFAGGFVAYLARTRTVNSANIRRAIVFGSAAASFAVEAFSVDRFANLSANELLERCEQFVRLVSFQQIAF